MVARSPVKKRRPCGPEKAPGRRRRACTNFYRPCNALATSLCTDRCPSKVLGSYFFHWSVPKRHIKQGTTTNIDFMRVVQEKKVGGHRQRPLFGILCPDLSPPFFVRRFWLPLPIEFFGGLCPCLWSTTCRGNPTGHRRSGNGPSTRRPCWPRRADSTVIAILSALDAFA